MKKELVSASTFPLLQLMVNCIDVFTNILYLVVMQEQSAKNQEKAKSHLTATCRALQSFFPIKKAPLSPNDSWILRKPLPTIAELFQAIANGEQEKTKDSFGVRNMIFISPKLWLERANATAMGGQLVLNKTPLEWVMWGLDKHMWNAMVDGIPRGKEGINLVKALLSQAKAVMEMAQNYANMDDADKPYINYAPLQQAYLNFNNKCQQYWLEDPNSHADELNDLFLNIGKELRFVAVALRNEFCRKDRLFKPTPKFDESDDKELPRTLNFLTKEGEAQQWVGVLNNLDSIEAQWLGILNGLGSDFTLCTSHMRGEEPYVEKIENGVRWQVMEQGLFCIEILEGCIAGSWRTNSSSAQIDCSAITAYVKARTENDFPALISRLEDLLLKLELEPELESEYQRVTF